MHIILLKFKKLETKSVKTKTNYIYIKTRRKIMH